MIEFKLPSLGADMDEGKLLEWRVKPGEAVKRGQVVALVDTSKAAVDVEIWHEGTVFELLTAPGEKIPVGTVMATLLEPGEDAASAKRAAPKTAGAPQAAAAPSIPVPVTAAPRSTGARKAVSPAARRRASELGVDPDALTGTGPQGAVTIADVEAAAARGATPAPTPAPAAAATPADRNAEMRRAIAAAMSRSKREIPHYYLSEPVDMRAATTWLGAQNAGRPITERILMGVLQLKAVALALKEFPDLNGFYRDGAYAASGAIHIGVAISLRQGGLIAPAIHDVDAKDLVTLMRDLADLVKRTRAGSLKSSEMSDPTITVTNLGEQGVDSVHGVIYPPQVALVGFGRMVERPWVIDGRVAPAPIVTASLAADHRVSDGHRGGRFLASVRDWMQRPQDL